MSDVPAPDDNDPLGQLEKDYEETRMIQVVQRGDEAPSVHWDTTLTENDVISSLFKALLFMTIDEYMASVFDDDEDEYEEELYTGED